MGASRSGTVSAAEWLGPQGRLVMVLGTLLTALVATGMRGDLVLIAVHFIKQYRQADVGGEAAENITDYSGLLQGYHSFLRSLNMQDVHWLVLYANLSSFISFYAFGGWLHWYFYVRQKDNAEEWKCQPKKWLTPENERHEVMLGSVNMAIGSTIAGIVATYILNGGCSLLYFNALERGWLYLIASTIIFFLAQDAMAYYFHRAYHFKFWYKHFHKHHHRYHSPTAWSATAMHPVEFVILQLAIIAPIFVIPTYSGSFICTMLYNYYYGMVDHSGVKMDALWPWQPSSMFHDNHHKLFHVNFGFNCKIWDWLHDTLRKESRHYAEDIFYGRGEEKQTEVKSK